MKPKKEKLFATEVELCAAFISALPDGWTAYAETAGWDILLVRNSDGCQIGVQAKLKLNAAVFSQALEDSWVLRHGPDFRAVLVPTTENGPWSSIAAYIGITVIQCSEPLTEEQKKRRVYYHRERFRPELPQIDDSEYNYANKNWHEQVPTARHAVPEYVPDVQAGASAPTQLTPWKIKALRIAATVEIRGWVAREDFKHHGIDHRRWIAADYQWLRPDPVRGCYVAGPRLGDFQKQHPRVYAEIVADADKWLPPEPELKRPPEPGLL